MNNYTNKNKLLRLRSFMRRNKTLRWFIFLFFAWILPSIIFWSGITVFVSEEGERDHELIKELASNDLSSLVYDATPTRYLQLKLSNFYKQLRGFKIDASAFEKIIRDFQNTFPKDSMEIYVFDGNSDICKIMGAKPEHKVFFDLINKDFLTVEGNNNLLRKQISALAQLFPAPELLLNASINKPDTVIVLGNPNRYSYCYWNMDKSIKSKFAAGILIFIHEESFSIANIVHEVLQEKSKENFGFFSEGEARLPGLIKDIPLPSIINQFSQNPTNSFLMDDRVINVEMVDGDIHIISAFEKPSPPTFLLILVSVAYLIATIIFLRITYAIFKKNEIYHHNIKHRLIALFTLCYCLPLVSALFLTTQYLYRFNHRSMLEERINNYRILSEVDKGFDRFITGQLMELRRQTAELNENYKDPNYIINHLDNYYQSFKCDSIHLISSQSKVLYTTDFVGAEIRKHAHLPLKEKEKIYESWKARNASTRSLHREVLFENKKLGNIANLKASRSEIKNFKKLFTSTALSAMDFHNNSHGILGTIKRDTSSLLIDTIIENTSFALFHSAHTNISRFTTMQTIDQISLGYLDIIANPENQEAWYCYGALIDLATLEYEYLNEIFSNLDKHPHLEGLVAVSNAPFATNFPKANEFKNFEEIIKRSEGDTKTFTHQMTINGAKTHIETLRCSFLQHYLLLKTTNIDKAEAIFERNLFITAILFSGFIFAGFILALLLVRLIIRPIEDLIKGIKEYSNQNYSHKIPVYAGNDFGILANASNHAAALANELKIEQEIKKLLYPDSDINCGSYILEVGNQSSRAVPSDFYDFISLKQGQLAFIMAKIPHNNLASALNLAKIKTSFRLLASKYPKNPEKILEEMNRAIITQSIDSKPIITCIVGIVDPTNDNITLANASYTYPITISHDSKNIKFVRLPSSPLGQNLETTFVSKQCIANNQTFILYSEGVTALTAKNGEPLGHEAFLQIINEGYKKQNRLVPAEMLKMLAQQTTSLPWEDDITLLTIQTRL
jgi:serine phosphatase RsbU (regulator of sigma subunit)